MDEKRPAQAGPLDAIPGSGPATRRNLWEREIYPRCMRNALMEIKERYGKPVVYITENGHECYEAPDENGNRRIPKKSYYWYRDLIAGFRKGELGPEE